jgi:hypothetical protein
LVLVETKTGTIRRGDILLFFPDKPGEKELPKTTFYNLFNSNFNSLDGTYALVNLGDVKCREMVYKDHQQTQFRFWNSKEDPKAKDGNCRSWYLNTTTYLDWEMKTDTKYLGNTCSGCPPNQKCDGDGGY